METGKIHNQAIEDRMLIDDRKLDFFGDELFRVTFSYHQNADESMLITRVSERKKYHAFPGSFSLN